MRWSSGKKMTDCWMSWYSLLNVDHAHMLTRQSSRLAGASTEWCVEVCVFFHSLGVAGHSSGGGVGQGIISSYRHQNRRDCRRTRMAVANRGVHVKHVVQLKNIKVPESLVKGNKFVKWEDVSRHGLVVLWVSLSLALSLSRCLYVLCRPKTVGCTLGLTLPTKTKMSGCTQYYLHCRNTPPTVGNSIFYKLEHDTHQVGSPTN